MAEHSFSVNSILPAHLSDLERDLDIALARIENVNIPISVLWNPFECPIDVLPYLAWALSVDQWKSSWSEDTKRKVVANSLEVHRKKGTRPAVEAALAAFNIKTELKEWFESDPMLPKGTFNIDVIVPQQGISKSLLSEISQEINNSKRKSAHYVLKAVASSDMDVNTALYTSSSVNTIIEPYLIKELKSKCTFAVAIASISAVSTIVEARE